MSVYLGLDVSTSCTGWCVFTSETVFAEMGKIDLAKKKGVYQKADIVRNVLSNLLIKYPITHVYIEENLQAFRPGLSSAKTLSTLARFNGIVSLLCYETFNLEPEHLNVNAARKALGIKLIRKKQGGAPTKEQVWDWVSADLDNPGYQWPTKVLKSGPRKGAVILDPGCFDMADAYVIAKAGIIARSEHSQNSG